MSEPDVISQLETILQQVHDVDAFDGESGHIALDELLLDTIRVLARHIHNEQVHDLTEQIRLLFEQYDKWYT